MRIRHFWRVLALAATLWAVVPASAYATFALVNHTNATSTDDKTAVTGSVDTSGADLIIVAGSSSSSADGTLTDARTGCASPCNTWVPLTASDSGPGHYHTQLFYAWNTTGSKSGTGHVFTFTYGTVSYPAIAVAWFSGSRTASDPFDLQSGAGNESVSLTIQPGSVTPTETNELIIGGSSNSAGVTVSVVDAGTSFTLIENVGGGAHWFPVGLAYGVQTTATAVNPTWTFVTSTTGKVVTQATFRTPAATTTAHRLPLTGAGK